MAACSNLLLDVCLCTVQIRNLKKKLQQIEALEARRQDSHLDPQQQSKLAQRAEVCAALQALQGGASLEEAHKAALSQRALLPSTSASCGLNRSLSTLSMDSIGSGGKHKSTAGKHRPTASRASRQNLAEQPRQAQDSNQGECEAAVGPSAGHAADEGAVGLTDAQDSDQTSAGVTPSHPQPVPKAPLTPVTQPSTTANVAQQIESAPHADSAAAAVAMTKPLPWGGSAAASSPVASLRVSGFDTPLGHKAEGSAWCSHVGASMPSPVPLSSSMLGTPPSLGAAKKTKPARKGGLSMFLSGETALVHTVCLASLPQICSCCKACCVCGKPSA